MPASDPPPDDALSQILRSLRLSSGLISRGHFTAPWAVHTPAAPHAIFHAVVEGRCVARRDADLQAVGLEEGELVLFTHGDGHVVGDAEGTRSRPVGGLPSQQVGGLVQVEHGGGGALTRVLCGRFSLQHAAAPLEELLPPVIVVRRQQSRMVEWLDTTLGLIAWELDHRRQGSDVILTRLTDILFVQVLRTYALGLRPGEGGWLGAVHDARIARALALLHEAPEQPWTAELLARRVGMSRSAFYARFTELIAETPARYLVRWRVRTSIDLMARQELSALEVAERVGYSSEDAFARAFRRVTGQTPSAWRKVQPSSGAG